MPRSVLVVDDDPAFRDLASRILRAWGHQVIGEAGSVGEALLRAGQLRPDAVVADIALPDGDGFDLTGKLSALPWPILVVLISSDPDAATSAAAQRVGARGFVAKADFSDSTLRALLDVES